MSEEIRRRGLGRGLSALLGEEPAAPAPASRGVERVPVAALHPGRFQPRREFAEESIAALAQSIAAQGVLQPLLVRRHPSLAGQYEIVAGERRWRAAQRAQVNEVPVVVRDLDDRAALELALVENVQREDLRPLDEARGYQRLIDEFGYTQEALAERVGKSRPHVANLLRLLHLPPAVQALVDRGELSPGHARALLVAPDAETLARRVVSQAWSVRRLEDEMRRAADKGATVNLAPRDPNIAALERDLATALGLKLEIHEGKKGGSVVIHYRTLDQFDMLLRKLGGIEEKE